jgi:hypothetical protein
MREALEDWVDQVGDMGRLSEDQMVASWYPGGKQPVTAAPIFVPISVEKPGLAPADGGELTAPALLQMQSATQGASIAFTLEQDSDPRWLLYSEPIALPAGEVRVRAKAIRIGYAESAESEAVFQVR